jgi:hypothetical protein
MREEPSPVPTFDEFALFVRDFTGYPVRKAITPATLLEKDMGVTGDDGTDLLEATQKRFDVDWADIREAFKLGPNEYLFHGEGFGLFPLWLVETGARPSIRPFTVGDLYDVVCQTLTA